MSDDVKVKESDESMKRIFALKQVVDAANVELESAKENLKLKRALHKKALETLQDAIDEEGQPSLFSAGITVTQAEIDAAKAEVDARPDVKDDEDDGEMSLPENGQWRGSPVADLGSKIATPELVKNMAEHTFPMRTLGELHKFITSPGSQTLMDVPGYNKKLAKKVSDGLFEFIKQCEEAGK